jgi:hypothetical protein
MVLVQPAQVAQPQVAQPQVGRAQQGPTALAQQAPAALAVRRDRAQVAQSDVLLDRPTRAKTRILPSTERRGLTTQ